MSIWEKLADAASCLTIIAIVITILGLTTGIL